MARSIEYSVADGKETDLLLACHALRIMNDMGEAIVRTPHAIQGWLAYRAQLDTGVLGIIVQRDSVTIERHSHFVGSAAPLMEGSARLPVDRVCNAQDCMHTVKTPTTSKRTRIGYIGAALFAWMPQEDMRLLSGDTRPLTLKNTIVMTGDPWIVGGRLAELEGQGHTIYDEVLLGLASTKYAEYYP